MMGKKDNNQQELERALRYENSSSAKITFTLHTFPVARQAAKTYMLTQCYSVDEYTEMDKKYNKPRTGLTKPILQAAMKKNEEMFIKRRPQINPNMFRMIFNSKMQGKTLNKNK